MLITKLRRIKDSIDYNQVSSKDLIDSHKQLVEQLIDAYMIIQDIREFNVQLYGENYVLKQVVGIPVQSSDFLS